MKGFIAALLAGVVLGAAAWYFFATTERTPESGSPTEMTAVQKDSIAAEIDSLTAEWWRAWEVFDLERGLSFVHDAPETTWVGGGAETLSSLEEIREAWAHQVSGLARQELEFTNQKTIVLAPDVVWTLREMAYTVVDTAGEVVGEGQFIETAVWVKRGGEWKILMGHDDDTTPIG